MRDLTVRQERALDRIADSPAAEHARVVGWIGDVGPVLRVKDRLVVLTGETATESIEELEA